MNTRSLLTIILSTMILCFVLVAVFLWFPPSAPDRLNDPPNWHQRWYYSTWQSIAQWQYQNAYYQSAAHSYRRSFPRIWTSPDDLGNFAESLIIHQPDDISEEASNLIQLLLAQDENHHKGLWLAAVEARRQNQLDTAASYLVKLLRLLPPMSANARRVQQDLIELQHMMSPPNTTSP